MNQLSNDEKIAKFMNLPYQKGNNGHKRYTHVNFEGEEWGYEHDGLLYSKSWDWIMPVVQKINELYEHEFPSNEEFIRSILEDKKVPVDRHFMDVIAIPVSSSIDEVNENIIKFIDWYETRQTKTS